jgi:hypothetical protein
MMHNNMHTPVHIVHVQEFFGCTCTTCTNQYRLCTHKNFLFEHAQHANTSTDCARTRIFCLNMHKMHTPVRVHIVHAQELFVCTCKTCKHQYTLCTQKNFFNVQAQDAHTSAHCARTRIFCMSFSTQTIIIFQAPIIY